MELTGKARRYSQNFQVLKVLWLAAHPGNVMRLKIK